MIKKILKNNKGVSLVEIIISIAILAIISVSMIQILSGSFRNVIFAGRNNQETLQAAGELDIAIREQTYTGKNNNVDNSDSTINVLGTDIEVRIIKSKTENLDSSINTNSDPFLYVYVTDPDIAYQNQAFIDENDNQSYDSDEKIITAEELDGTYYYNGSGVLTIIHQESLVNDIENIDWRIKDGIYIKENLNINSNNEIEMYAYDGNIDIQPGVNLEAKDKILLSSKEEIEISKVFIKSIDEDIVIESKEVRIFGDNTLVTHMEVESSSKKIIFKVDDEIHMNDFVEFIISGSNDYAINRLDATLSIANDTEGSNKFR